MSATSGFTDYNKIPFDDHSQQRLKRICDEVHWFGHRFMLSNSDGKAINASDDYLEQLYASYDIQRVFTSRSVSANAARRGEVSELLVRNYG